MSSETTSGATPQKAAPSKLSTAKTEVEFRVALALLVIVALIPAVVSNAYWLCVLVVSMYFAILAGAWNLLAGYTGLVSFGHQVFVALGAYGLLVVSGWLGVSPYWILPVAPVVCAMVAAVIAVPLFRLREAYFSIAMWVFSEIIGAITMKSAWLGGTSGVPLVTSKLIDFDWFEPVMFWIASALALGTVGGFYLLLTSSFGLG